MSELPPAFSNYPRGPVQFPGDHRPPGVYADVIRESWKLVLTEWTTYCLATLVFLGVPATLTRAIAMLMGGQFGALFLLVCGNLFFTGMSYMALRQLRGNAIRMGDMFAAFDRFGTVLVVSMLQSLAIAVGLAFFIVPGIFLAGALAFAPLLALDQGFGPVGALVGSYRALRRDAWAMFALLFVLGLLVGLGAFAYGLGLLFALPLMKVAVAKHYLYYFPPSASRHSIGPKVE